MEKYVHNRYHTKNYKKLIEKGERMRLAKFLANAGIASRRQAEQYIAAGRVKVNGGMVREQGVKIDPGHDKVMFDNDEVSIQSPIYILLNKPAGYISSVGDPQGRPTVIDLLKDIPARIYPVGRLDFDTEGLLLLSNDGEFTNMMIHPRYQIEKKYLVWASGSVTPSAVDKLQRGVVLDDGTTAPAGVKILEAGDATTLLEITIHEGKKREIKRMCAAVGHPIIKLTRTSLDFLTLKGVARGKYRYLTPAEVKRLQDTALKGLPRSHCKSGI